MGAREVISSAPSPCNCRDKRRETQHVLMVMRAPKATFRQIVHMLRRYERAHHVSKELRRRLAEAAGVDAEGTEV
ncbi:unnamed protein product, partial [Ectocarpus sp. 13 AM-2016]